MKTLLYNKVLASLCIFVILCLAATPSIAQKTTKVSTPYVANSLETFSPELLKKVSINKRYHLLVHFDETPNQTTLEHIEKSGIQFLSFKGDNVYTLAIPTSTKKETLQAIGIKQMTIPSFQLKVSSVLQQKIKSEKSGTIELAVSFHKNINKAAQTAIIKQYKAVTIKEKQNLENLHFLQLPIKTLENFAHHPAISFIDIKEGEPVKINYENKAIQGVRYLASSINGGRDLQGDGVVVGIGDGGELGNHIDFGNRAINYASGNYASFGAHGDHVAGTVAGAGNIEGRHAGMAPNSTLIIQKTSRITSYADDYFNDHGMTLTNNSYGSSSDCGGFGEYTYTSASLDQQLGNYPELLHVFAAGNSGSGDCGVLPKGYGTILRAYATAKNVLTVGAVDVNLNVAGFSSRGPASDGRLKPEIMGTGVGVVSTARDYNYTNMSGTSMAAPSVTGTLALITQRFKTFNSGQNPTSACLKAIACNTATDLGNHGPDYLYGFGLINGKRAIEAVENGWFGQGNVGEGQTKTHLFTVHGEAQQLKIMLAWTDTKAEAYPTKALVNDLDLEVKAPDGTIFQPWVLNTSNVTDEATRGKDQLNNMEQVTIDLPQAGTYEIIVKGSNFPIFSVKNQDYALSYDVVKPNITLTYPLGGQSIQPNKKEYITWDAPSNDDRTFKLEYSTNGGTSWTVLSASIPATKRSFEWTTPSTSTTNLVIRLRRNSTAYYSVTNEAILVINRPTLATEMLCDSKVQLNWNALAEANSYNIYRYDGTKMVLEANTGDNNYIVSDNLNNGDTYWFAVSAVAPDGRQSLRSIAKPIEIEPNACANPTDLELSFAQFRKSGRQFSSSSLSNSEDITLNVKNTSTNTTINGFEAYYSINGKIFQESVTASIEPGASFQYNFNKKADFSTPGNYSVEVWVEAENEENLDNNRINPTQVRQLANAPVTMPIVDLFAAMTNGSYSQSMMGIANNNSTDFNNLTNGQVSILEEKESTLITLGGVSATSSSSMELVHTLNLSNHLESRILLSFDYRTTSAQSSAEASSASGVSLWSRGSDNDEWIKIKNFTPTSEWTTEQSLDITGTPVEVHTQALSSTFQFKIVVEGDGGLEIKNMGAEDGGTLPVELTFFKAEKISETGVLLRWQTASELNNDYFEVQVAKDIETLRSERFETIEKVEGHGTTAATQNYSFTHYMDARFGEYYYRLKQVDYDGAFEYSDIVSVRFEKNIKSYTLYPTLVKGNTIALDLDAKQKSTADIRLIDLSGQLMKEYNIAIQKGAQTLQLELPDGLETGTYHLITKVGINIITRKFMKIKL